MRGSLGRTSMHKAKRSSGDIFFSFVCYFLIAWVCFVSLYPFVFVVSASLSSAGSVMRNEVLLFPKGTTLRAYDVVVHYRGLWAAYGNTIFYTLAGTALSLVLTSLAAYPLSIKQWKMRRFCSFFVVFTIWFSGGMIPFFLTIKGLGLYNTRLSILLYPAVNAFYVIIMKTYFESIPASVVESAKLDGANDLTILFRIVVPVAIPTFAAIGLYYAVGRWNSFFWEMTLLSDEWKMPVQVLLQRIILASQLGQDMERALTRGEASIPLTIKYACIVVTTLPILVFYPFVQKYFKKGVMVGSIKG
jgi:ABC-type sugar transport system, permease component